jgi:hypothetical protein
LSGSDSKAAMMARCTCPGPLLINVSIPARGAVVEHLSIGVQNTLNHVLVSGESLLRLCAVYAKIFRRHIGIQFQLHCRKCRSRSHRGCGTAGPDFCWWWPSRLVATASEDRLIIKRDLSTSVAAAVVVTAHSAEQSSRLIASCDHASLVHICTK